LVRPRPGSKTGGVVSSETTLGEAGQGSDAEAIGIARRGEDRTVLRTSSYTQQARPIELHKVERSMSTPWCAEICDWRYSGRWSAYLLTSTCASSAPGACTQCFRSPRLQFHRLRRRNLGQPRPAAIARPAAHLNAYLRGDVIKCFGAVFADRMRWRTAAPADLVGDIDHDLHPRQMLR
jgi:hypothetical protein